MAGSGYLCRCGAEFPSYGSSCKECGADFVRGWICNCGSYCPGYECEECGLSRADFLKREKLVGLFTKELMREVANIVWGYANKRGIPRYLVDDSISTAFVNAIKAIDSYDPGKGSFKGWVAAIAINALRNEVGRDLRLSDREVLRLDYNSDKPGERPVEEQADLVGELGLYNPGSLDIILDEEERASDLREKRRLAVEAMGTYVDSIGRERTVYSICLEAFNKVGYGWVGYAAMLSGMSRPAIQARIAKAREVANL